MPCPSSTTSARRRCGSAVALVTADPGAAYLAGGTTQLDLLKDGVIGARRLVDISRLPLRGITAGDGTLRVGALTTMEELAADPTVARAAAAGPRGAARRAPRRSCGTWRPSAGTCCSARRCRYFRDPAVPGVQQAHARYRAARRSTGPAADARDPRHERALHRPARLATCACRWSRSTRSVHIQGAGGRARRPADRVLPCCPATPGRGERARATAS